MNATLIVSIVLLVVVLVLLRVFYSQRRIVKTLRASEKKFSSAFRHSPDAFMITSLAEGKVLEINDGFTRIMGYRREEIVGRSTLDLRIWVNSEDRDRWMKFLQEHGRIQDFEIDVRHKSGEIRTALVAGEVIELDDQTCVLSLARDITEFKRAQQALRLSEDKFAKTFRATPDAILITSLVDGKVVEVNDGFLRITGYSREEVIGRTVADFNLWVDPAARDRLVGILRKEGRVRNRQEDYRGKSGEVIHTLISIEIIDIDGEPHIFTVGRDITDQRRAEQEREAFVEELEAKNTELERFTYTVSHDLKSPLVTIRGFLGYLREDLAAGNVERAEVDMERIAAAAASMSQLLDELLELSRIGRIVNPPEEIALSELAGEAVALVATRIAELGVEVVISRQLPTVVGDRHRLLEVLQNLIDNAVKFMGEQAAPRIEIGTRRDGDEAVFYVTDNGIGIEERYQERVFDLFDRLDPSVPGTGIGLTLVKRIVEVHGGRVWLESPGRGHGCTFCFTLASQDGADRPTGSSSSSSGDSPGSS